MASIKHKLIYEHPLNERTRMWLRLESLFSQVLERSKGNSMGDSRSAMLGLLDILDFLARNDCRKAMGKELETRLERLSTWRNNEEVDDQRLEEVLNGLRNLADGLAQQDRALGHELSENHLISKVRQRASIPGGTCPFDIPAYHFWLQQPVKDRQRDLADWLRSLDPFREALQLNLYLIRNHTVTSRVTAQEGVYQSNFSAGGGFPILRVLLPEDLRLFPEVSGGAQRFTIRFFEYYNVASRPIQTERDVDFELCRCLA